jgi:addiction module HigA family antidote
MAYAAKRGKSRCPIHPGVLLRDDIIPATGRTKAEIAGLLGISRQHLYDILGERKPVSPSIAVRLGKLFGDGAGIWTRMQGAYDTCMRSEPKTSVTFQPSRLKPPETCPFGGTSFPPIFTGNWCRSRFLDCPIHATRLA